VIRRSMVALRTAAFSPFATAPRREAEGKRTGGGSNG
jgi:hypothetical protein